MKLDRPALNLALFALALSLLTGCDSLGIPDILAHDQVPQEAKDAPRTVGSPPPVVANTAWPRVGDVPTKPKDFSPKPVYDHYMDELTDDRTEAQAEKKEVEKSVQQDAPSTSSQPVPPVFPPTVPKE